MFKGVIQEFKIGTCSTL